MKKVLALLLVLVLAIGMFAACGTDSGNNEETKDTANNATTEGGNDETKPSEENGNNTEGKTLKVGIRPEDIKDDEEFLEKHPNSHISAEVEVSELMGAEIYLYLEYKDYKMTARVNPGSSAKNGTDVKVAINTKKLHLFDPETELAILN
mgnify:CR=1 FL=1